MLRHQRHQPSVHFSARQNMFSIMVSSAAGSAPGGDTSNSTLCPKTVTFHLDFGSEIVEQARYERLTLYSLEHLRLADMALGRIKGE